MNFSLANKNKQRQIRKKVVIEDENEDKLNKDNNTDNNNNDNNEEQPQIIKPIINKKKTTGSSNTFSTKSNKSTTTTTTTASLPSSSNNNTKKKTLNLFSFGEEEGDIEQQDNEDEGIKFNPISISRNVLNFDDSKTATVHNESLGQYTTEMINTLKKNTTSKPATTTTNTMIDNIDDKMEIDHRDYTDDTTTSIIPSIEQIKLAKEKRQRARDGKWKDGEKSSSTSATSRSLSKDFLPLNVSGSGGGGGGDNDEDNEKSRIVREEDDDEIEEEYNIKASNTIKFGDPGKTNKKDEQIQKEINNNGEEDEEEEDEEITKWRFEQIRKGSGVKVDSNLQTFEFERKKFEKELLSLAPSENTHYKSSSILNNASSSSGGTPFIESVCKDFNSILVQLNEVKHNHQLEFEKVQEALRDSVISLSIMESEYHVNQDQFVFYDELKQYCNNMIDCLGEKIPEIEKLEDRYIELLKDYSYDVRKQFKTQLSDQIYNIQEESESSTQVIMKNQDKDGDDNLDEFGRDRDYYEKSSRKNRLELYNTISGDEESLFKLYSEQDELYYKNEKSKVIEMVNKTMEDVDPDYCDIVNIVDKFKHWKSKDLKSYQKSQMPFIMPSIFAPFVRLQMIQWSPLFDVIFDTLNWYNHLFNYHSSDDKDGGDDEDNNIIPKLVEKIIIPKTETFITYIWNPLNTKETINLKNTIDEILIYIGEDDKDDSEIKYLFSQIISTLKYSISNENLSIPYSSKDLTFSIKMYMLSLNLLDSIKIWSTNYQFIQLNSLMAMSDEIIDFQILPFLRKIYSDNNNKHSSIDSIFNLFDSFYQYLISLPWSNKKYKNSIHSLLSEIQVKHSINLSNDNLTKLNNIYLPYFS